MSFLSLKAGPRGPCRHAKCRGGQAVPARPSPTATVLLLCVLLGLLSGLIAGPLEAAATRAASLELPVPPPDTPRPFSSTPFAIVAALTVVFGILGVLRALVPARWKRAPWRWLRAPFDHAMRLGWLASVPAFVLDGLILLLGDEYHHGWVIVTLTLFTAPFAAGLQWEKARWNTRRNREEPYPQAFNYYVGMTLAALLPALAGDFILWRFAEAGALHLAVLPFNLLTVVAVAGSLGFALTKLGGLLLRAILLPHRLIMFFVDPSSRFYALIVTLPLVGMGVFHYYTIPFFFEAFGFTLPPIPSASLDQALVILIPNAFTVLCVTYFSIFSGMFVAMLPIMLFSRSLRKEPTRPPTIDELIRDPERSRAYLGREFTHEDVWPTIATIAAYNEPPDPLEKTIIGYVRLIRSWIDRGLPPEKYIILFSHQTEREEERNEFENFVRCRFPQYALDGLIDRDWEHFNEDNPTASIRSEKRLSQVLSAWLEHKGIDLASTAGKAEFQKRRVCQRLLEFSQHAPRRVFGLPDPPARSYAGRPVTSWIWYYLIPKTVEGKAVQVTSKAHNLQYAREGIWGKAESSPLERDGIFRDAPEWLFDISDADAEIHPACVDGILASYSPFYKEPRLGWVQRLSYTIEPEATFLSRIKSASETAYWSWYLRARVHTYTRHGEPLYRVVGDHRRPIRRDFQAANGHNMVVRGTSVQAAGGDVEHEVAKVYEIESPIKRWLTHLRGRPVRSEYKLIEKWVPTGEDLELATRMSLEGYHGDYAPYAPQGEGSPADFRGNVPQAIRWSGNNVQLIFMHLAKTFATKRWTFNEKMGYFVNLATLASAPLLYLTVLRAALMPFLGLPDVYAAVHPGLGPIGFVLALAPNFLLLSLALTGQLVVDPKYPWQRTVLKPWHRVFLRWFGCLVVPPLSILVAAFLPGWLQSAGVEVPRAAAWAMLGTAVLLNVLGLVFRRQVYAGLAYCILLLPFLQVLYLSWIIFGIMGTVNMIVKTQIVEPYISRLVGTHHPAEAGRYPADGSGRFLAMTDRFPWLFSPFKWMKDQPGPTAVALGSLVGLLLWVNPPWGWPGEAAGAVGLTLAALWLWKRLPGLLLDWLLDRGSLVNRWWDYWTNPQPAFVKTIKEREERSLSTLFKDNFFGMVNGLFVLALIVHVHFVNAGTLSAAFLAYLTFSVASSWVISPFFYEEPHRTLRSHGHALLVALSLVGAFLFFFLDFPERMTGRPLIPIGLKPWINGLLAVAALGGIVNLAPLPNARAFAKRFALAAVMLSLLFLTGLTVSYRGVAVEPLQENWAMEADSAYLRAVRDEEITSAEMADLEAELERAERNRRIALVKERLALDYWTSLSDRRSAEASEGLSFAQRNLEFAQRALELELERARYRREVQGFQEGLLPSGAVEAALDNLYASATAEQDRRLKDLQAALQALQSLRSGACEAAPEAKRDEAASSEKVAAAFEASVVDRARRSVREAEEFLARLQVLRSGPASPEDVARLAILPMGELQAARRGLDLAQADLARAQKYADEAQREIWQAEQAYRVRRTERESAWEYEKTLSARHEEVRRKPRKSEDLDRETVVRAKKIYTLNPDRYQPIVKSLFRYREVLEVNSSREKLARAIDWIAAHHWVKDLTLKGAVWYPKEAVMTRLVAELPAKLRFLRETEARYRRLVLSSELLLAERCAQVGAFLLPRLIRPAEAAAPKKTPVASGLSSISREALDDLVGDFDAVKALHQLENQWEELRASESSAAEASVARAALESAANLLSSLDRRFQEAMDQETDDLQREALAEGLEKVVAWQGGGRTDSAPFRYDLEERLVDALSREAEGIRRQQLPAAQEKLRAWQETAVAQNAEVKILSIAASSPLPGDLGQLAPELRLALQKIIEPEDLAYLLRAAEEANAQTARQIAELERLEEDILIEIDRLEPYIVGSLDPSDLQAAPPFPILLVRQERNRLLSEVEEAHDSLSAQAERVFRQASEAITRELRPQRDLLHGQLLQSLKLLRKRALAWAQGLSRDSAIALGRGLQLSSALSTLNRIFGVRAGGEDSREGQRGLLELEAEARGEAAVAAAKARRAPQDLQLAALVHLSQREVEGFARENQQAWQEVEAQLHATESLEKAQWDLFGTRLMADARNSLRLEDLGARTREALEEALTRRDLLEERLRQTEAAVAEAQASQVSEDELRQLLESPVIDANPADFELSVVEKRISDLCSELNRLEKSPLEAAAKTETAGAEDDSPRPGAARAASAPAGDHAVAYFLAVPDAARQALDHASQPGGAVFLAGKDVETAMEELRRSSRQILPDLFATAGANSTAPIIFQGGGFAVVTLSLDLLENHSYFATQTTEKEYLGQVAELLVVLRVLRAYGAVMAAELQQEICRSLEADVSQRLASAGPRHAAASEERWWLALAGQRLKLIMAEGEAELSARRRVLSQLRGKALDEAFTTLEKPPATLQDAQAQLDKWAQAAESLVRERFEKHPVFESFVTSLEKYSAMEREAQLRHFWPVLRAGGGAAAPSDTPFGIGASLVFPLLDRTADLAERTAVAEKERLRSVENEQLFLEHLRQNLARARRRLTTDGIIAEDGILEARRGALSDTIVEYRHGFAAKPMEVDREVQALGATLSTARSLFDSYVVSCLDLVESGARLSASEIPGLPPPSKASSLTEAVEGAPRSTPAAAREEKKLLLLEAERQHEDQVVDRFGIGASVSYSGILIPMPGVELTYGVSQIRKEAVGLGILHGRARVKLSELEARRAALAAHLDWLHDATVEEYAAKKVEASEKHAALAERLVERGLAAPPTSKLAKAQALEARRNHGATRGQKDVTASLYRSVIGAAPPDVVRREFTRKAIDAVLAPDSPAMKDYRETVVREALVAEADCRWAAFVAKLENKKPYGGLVANLITPLWDLWRLWQRPGTPEEIAAALEPVKKYLRENGDVDADRFTKLLDEAKDVLAGDGYEPKEVGTAALLWRQAALALEAHDEEATQLREAARTEYEASLGDLRRMAKKIDRLSEEIQRFAETQAVGDVSPLRRLALVQSTQDAAVEYAGILHRYARVRSEQIFYGNSLEPAPLRPPGDAKAKSASELVEATVARSPELRRALARVSVVGRQVGLARGLSPVEVSLPTSVPSLGIDPRFAGSALTTSLGFAVRTERYRELAEGEPEVLALRQEALAREAEARIGAINDIIKLRAMEDSVLAWRRELEARREILRNLEALRREGEVPGTEVLQAEGAAEEAAWRLASAELETELLKEQISSRSGMDFDVAPVLESLWRLEPLNPDAGEGSGSPQASHRDLQLAAAKKELEALAPEARAMAERASGADSTASWWRKEGWLGTRLELVASLGQSPDEADFGGGGFLSLPVHTLLGVKGSGARLSEIEAERRKGEAERLAWQAGERAEELYRRLADQARIRDQALREVALASRAYDAEAAYRKTNERTAQEMEIASNVALGALEGFRSADESYRSTLAELAERAPGFRDMVIAPVAPDLTFEEARQATDEPSILAAELVQLATALSRPRSARELDEVGERTRMIDEELAALGTTPVGDLARRLGLSGSLSSVARVLERDPSSASLLRQTGELSRRVERNREALVGRGQSRMDLREAEAIDDAWSELKRSLLSRPDVAQALAEALAEKLAQEKAELEERRKSLEGEMSRRPDTLDQDSETAIWSRALGNLEQILGAQASTRSWREKLSSLERALQEVRRAKIRDGVVRSTELHQADLRRKVERIDLHGKHERAVLDLRAFLCALRRDSPADYRRFVLDLRSDQISSLRRRRESLSAQRSRGGMEDTEKNLLDALPVFERRLSGGEADLLRRVTRSRGLLRDAMVEKSRWKVEAESAGEVITAELARTRAATAAVAESQLREKLSAEVSDFLKVRAVRQVLPEALQKLGASRRAALLSERDRCAREIELERMKAGQVRESLPIEGALRTIREKALKEALSDELREPILAAEQSLESLRRQAIRYRLAVERNIEWGAENAGTRFGRSPRDDTPKELRKLEACSRELEAAWKHLLEAAHASGRNGTRGSEVDRPSVPSWLAAALESLSLSDRETSDPFLVGWREDTVRQIVATRIEREKTLEQSREALPYLMTRLRDDEREKRREAAGRLLDRFPGADESKREIASLLEDLEAANLLRESGWALQRLFETSRQTTEGPLRLSREDVESIEAALGTALAAQALGIEEAELGAALLQESRGHAVEVRVTREELEARLESHLQLAASKAGSAEARLNSFFADLSSRDPVGLVGWVRASELMPPALVDRLRYLRKVQTGLSEAQARTTALEISFVDQRDDAWYVRAWQTADRSVERLRREKVFRILQPDLYRELSRKGYTDSRGCLLTLPDRASRDLEKAKNAALTLAKTPTFETLRPRIRSWQILGFLDIPVVRRVEPVPEQLRESLALLTASEAPLLVALSRSYEGRDECFTFDQAMHAMALILQESMDTEHGGVKQAELLLRRFLLYEEAERTSPAGFQGLPRAFFASSGKPADLAVDLAANAGGALACQLHASVSGSFEFLGLSRAIAERVLLPSLAEGGLQRPMAAPRSSAVASPLVAAALTLAVLRNEARIAAWLDDPAEAQRFSLEGDRLAQWIVEDSWDPKAGIFRLPSEKREAADAAKGGPGGGDADVQPTVTRLDAEANLFCLYVLSFEDRKYCSEELLLRGVRSLRRNLEVRDTLDTRLLGLTFQGNWFLNGPVDAYNSYVLPLWERIADRPLRRLSPEDAWVFLNHLLFSASEGRLGFKAKVRGLAQDASKARLDPACTAQAIWVLPRLADRINKLSRERRGREADIAAYEYEDELLYCSLPDKSDPDKRSWPKRVGEDEASRDPEILRFEGLLATLPACYWSFGEAARRGEFALGPVDLSKVEKPPRPRPPEIMELPLPGLVEATEQNLAAARRAIRSEKARLRDLVETTQKGLQRLGSPAPDGAVELPARVFRSVAWLERQIGDERGLLRTNEDPARPHACDPYTSALAIIQFSLAGTQPGMDAHSKAARRLWDGMLKLRGSDGQWADAYDRRTGEVLPGAENRATGPNSWMVLAGLHLYWASRDAGVLADAEETLDWVLSFQQTDDRSPTFGGITLGEVANNTMSTEANADALAAAWGMAAALKNEGTESRRYRGYEDAASGIAGWVQKMWRGDQALFFTGRDLPGGEPTMREEWLDSQTWTLLALDATREAHGLQPEAFNGLPSIDERELSKGRVAYGAHQLPSLSRVTTGPAAFWPEGAAGYVLAARIAGHAERFLEALDRVRNPDDSLPHMIGEETESRWQFNLRVKAVDATVWSTWADPELNFNPFRTGPPPWGRPLTQARSARDASARMETERASLEAMRRELEALERAERRLDKLQGELRALKEDTQTATQ